MEEQALGSTAPWFDTTISGRRGTGVRTLNGWRRGAVKSYD